MANHRGYNSLYEGKGAPLEKFIDKNVSPGSMQKWHFRCSDGVYTYLEIDSKYRVCHRAFAQDDYGNTFMCLWEFSECTSMSCPLGCICNMCLGNGPWLDGPCRCVVWDDDPNNIDFQFHKISINNIWDHLGTREKLAVYEVDPGFVYTKYPKAHEWYFEEKKKTNEEDGVYAKKNASRARREKMS